MLQCSTRLLNGQKKIPHRVRELNSAFHNNWRDQVLCKYNRSSEMRMNILGKQRVFITLKFQTMMFFSSVFVELVAVITTEQNIAG